MRNATFEFEILFIDDGSSDDTRDKLTSIRGVDNRIRVIFNDYNLGRGSTVAKGFRLSAANVVGFVDIDLSTQAIYIPYLTQLILDDIADVATCNRSYKIQLSVFHKIFVRYALSYGYRYFSRWYLGHGLRDTETGFKFFRREAIIPLLDQVEDTHWFWDTEIMVLAKNSCLRINEVDSIFIRRPQKPSTVKIARDVFCYLHNIFKFKRRMYRR